MPFSLLPKIMAITNLTKKITNYLFLTNLWKNKISKQNKTNNFSPPITPTLQLDLTLFKDKPNKQKKKFCKKLTVN